MWTRGRQASSSDPQAEAGAGPSRGLPSGAEPQKPTGESRRDARRVALLAGLLFGLAGTGSSATAVVLPGLQVDLGLTQAAAAWVLSLYALALAVTTAVYGRVADILGVRTPLVVGVLLMALGSVVSALAPSMPALLAGRVLQGGGAGGVAVLVTTLVATRFSGATRTAALGQVAGTAATLSSLGPLIGGVLDTVGGWRAVVALPLAAVALLPALARTAPPVGTGGRLDLVGAALVAVTAGGLVLCIQSPSAGLVVAGMGAALLVTGVPLTMRHVGRRPEGFLPRLVVTSGAAIRAALAGASVPAAWFALLIAVPATLDGRGWSPLQIGLALLPSAVVGLVSPRFAARVITRLGARGALTGAALVAAGSLGAAALAVDVGWPAGLAAATAALTVAFTVGQPAMVAEVAAEVPAAVRGVALGLASLVFLAGGSLGAAVIGGFAEVAGVPAALLTVAALPVVAAVTAGLAGRHRAAGRAAGR